MIGLASAHQTVRTFLLSLERTSGKKFFPQAGQVMYAPALEEALRKSPQQAVNKCGFFLQGDGPFEHYVYRLSMQILLTYPEARTDDDYIRALQHADDFVAQLNDHTVPGLGQLTRADGPNPIPNMGVLGIRIDFSIATINA